MNFAETWTSPPGSSMDLMAKTPTTTPQVGSASFRIWPPGSSLSWSFQVFPRICLLFQTVCFVTIFVDTRQCFKVWHWPHLIIATEQMGRCPPFSPDLGYVLSWFPRRLLVPTEHSCGGHLCFLGWGQWPSLVSKLSSYLGLAGKVGKKDV